MAGDGHGRVGVDVLGQRRTKLAYADGRRFHEETPGER
jgi:hypothetical protein